MGERGVGLVAASVGVGRVDGDLALEPGHLGQGVGDLPGGHGHHDHLGVGGVTAVAANGRDGMAGPLPAAGQPAADVAPAEHEDVHAFPSPLASSSCGPAHYQRSRSRLVKGIVGRPYARVALSRACLVGPAAAGWPAADPAPPDPSPGSARTSTGSDSSRQRPGQVPRKLKLVEEARRTEVPEGWRWRPRRSPGACTTRPSAVWWRAPSRSISSRQTPQRPTWRSSAATIPARTPPTGRLPTRQVVTWPTPPPPPPLPLAVVPRPAVRWLDGAILADADCVAAAVGHRDRRRPWVGRAPGRGHRRMRL